MIQEFYFGVWLLVQTCFESFFFSNHQTRKVLVLFRKCIIPRIYINMSEPVISPDSQEFGMNKPASLEATCPPEGGLPNPNDLNMNISFGKCFTLYKDLLVRGVILA